MLWATVGQPVSQPLRHTTTPWNLRNPATTVVRFPVGPRFFTIFSVRSSELQRRLALKRTCFRTHSCVRCTGIIFLGGCVGRGVERAMADATMKFVPAARGSMPLQTVVNRLKQLGFSMTAAAPRSAHPGHHSRQVVHWLVRCCSSERYSHVLGSGRRAGEMLVENPR